MVFLVFSEVPEMSSEVAGPGPTDERAHAAVADRQSKFYRRSTRFDPIESNTGQVVAELKVVTSNKLCEPIL